MGKAEAVRSIDTAKKTITWAEFIGAEKYALAIYRLQNEAGLTFKESRALLTPWDGRKELAEEWGCSVENVYNLSRKGYEKLDRHTGGDFLKNEELAPTLMRHAF